MTSIATNSPLHSSLIAPGHNKQLNAREFDRRLSRHRARLSRLSLRLARQSSDADDLLQEALTRAWANRQRFDASGNLGAWVSRILVNVFISKVRHRKVVDRAGRRPDLPSLLFADHKLGHSAGLDSILDNCEMAERIHRAMQKLPYDYRRVIEEVDLSDQSYQEAADKLEVPIGTVMSRLHRARRRLRKELEQGDA